MSTRRQTLRALGATAASGLSGCVFDPAGYRGVNENLEVVNRYAEPVELHVIVERNEPPGSQHLEPVFEANVSIAPGEAKTLDVLGDYQFRITVTWLDQAMSFWTRPICDGGNTSIIVANDGDLLNEVEYCE